MDAINIITEIYKQELAQANHQKVLFQAQCEIYKRQIDKLRKENEELKSTDKIDK